MYCLLSIMQRHKMTKLDKIISDLGPEERKILMEKLQKDELGNEKILLIQYDFSFLIFINNILKIIR